ncbi:MAG TPA: AAA family ATPase, partial [Flavobacterium sp.]|nr:AAA family ATPase [Flavobacterium sp.]
NEINDSIFNKINIGSKKPEIDDVFYFLYEDVLVDFDTNCSRIRILFKKTDIEKVEKIADGVSKFKERKRRRKPEISLLVNSRFGLETEVMEITKPKLNIEDNYNDDFLPIHKTITERLNKNKDKGLVLLHGKPGTGKTSYIRYLISSAKKRVIFLPPNMATSITSPNLLAVLIDNPNSIFVIEDAENIIIDREQNGASPVSALLNISDGLLSDCLNIQIICSFNTDLSRVDSALLRKGRLIAKYEFKELETQKAQNLSDKLGFQTEINKPMTLTDIYNQTEMNFQPERRKAVGF